MAKASKKANIFLIFFKNSTSFFLLQYNTSIAS